MCVTCSNRWMNNGENCPFCRTPLSSKVVLKTNTPDKYEGTHDICFQVHREGPDLCSKITKILIEDIGVRKLQIYQSEANRGVVLAINGYGKKTKSLFLFYQGETGELTKELVREKCQSLVTSYNN